MKKCWKGWRYPRGRLGDVRYLLKVGRNDFWWVGLFVASWGEAWGLKDVGMGK